MNILTFALIIGMSQTYTACCRNNETAYVFLNFSYFLVAFTIFVFGMNVYALIFPDYMWLTTHYYFETWIGHDVEDLHPFILARESSSLNHKAIRNMMKIDQIVTKYAQDQEDIDDLFA